MGRSTLARLLVFAALFLVGMLGVGAAYVVAKPLKGARGPQITICRTHGKTFTAVHANLDDLVKHANRHSHDIVPPFELVEGTTTTNFPGINMNSLYGAGFTGAEVLANQCHIPSGTSPAVTKTETQVESVPVTATVPATTMTLPGTTVTTEVTATVTVPQETVSVAPQSTAVSVEAHQAATVTLPAQTVVLPATTETLNVASTRTETVERPGETVTLPGTTTTVAAADTPTTVTVTGPSQVVREGATAIEVIGVVLTTPKRVVPVRAHAIKVRGQRRLKRKVLVVSVVRCTCPPGTRPIDGGCRRIHR
jgi:hypothetical protein